jgi:hypothetical protein
MEKFSSLLLKMHGRGEEERYIVVFLVGQQ